jgi:response regulator RpfG family c-di-GMP phosphodiesterase
MMNNKILCVDDEPNILNGYKRTLREKFDIFIAEGGAQGLNVIASEGPFAVVVSDMRMPVMDGVQFLSRVKEVSPDSVRIMLTGNADQKTAIDAVNEGNIFRFLNKPCSPEIFEKTLSAGIEQYRLITAEKQLLEHTLNNSLQVLVDILAMTNETAFARSSRTKKLAREIADQLKAENLWEIEIAAMLSQIGCIAVPEEILQRVASGKSLTEKEISLYQQHPQIGHDLIARIPRMETVAQIVANQNRRLNDRVEAKSQIENIASVTTGARILKVVSDYDKLINSGNVPGNVFNELASREGWYDADVLSALKKVIGERSEEYVCCTMCIAELRPGMILAEPLVSLRGTLLLASDQEVTTSLIIRLTNFMNTGMIADRIRAYVLDKN